MTHTKQSIRMTDQNIKKIQSPTKTSSPNPTISLLPIFNNEKRKKEESFGIQTLWRSTVTPINHKRILTGSLDLVAFNYKMQ